MPPKKTITVNIEQIKKAYLSRKREIRGRLAEFGTVRKNGTDEKLWEEMVYCFFTGGCSAKMGLRSIEAVRDMISDAGQPELAKALTGVHRYPNARSRYIVESRDFLHRHCRMRLREKLESFSCDLARRDWLANEKGIKGLGYKEASHFLRNVGFAGYAILDKHVLRCLHELGVIDDPKPPNSRSRYLILEEKLRQLAETARIDFDELDLVLWSLKTGEVLK